MSENTPLSTFRFMDQLPSEIRGKIFGHMVRLARQRFQKFQERNGTWHFPYAPTIWQIGIHLSESPWIKLNKKYCAEYLREFLKQVHFGEDFEHWVVHQMRRQDTKRAQAYGKVEQFRWARNAERRSKRMHTLDTCLRTIDRRLRIATAQEDLNKPFAKLSNYVSGIYVYHNTVFRSSDPVRFQSIEPCMARPLKQLRRLHEKYNIPPSKMYLHISYGSPSPSFAEFTSIHDRVYNRDFAESLRSVRPKIWVADYDASVAALDEEIRVLRGPLRDKLQEARVRYSRLNPFWDSVGALRASIERDITAVRRLHLRIIDDVIKFWKAQDGWYELDDMFKIAEAWSAEHED
ncbi:hypothetical protein M436DRAFT_86278 [Aureobasidium namibiae CBS 147.97]|uniref:Uncharacterized protein n=1 Tax=Aureobasidium namibiae CBS 147.97 TaxID=1043004 RepID=A0A074W6L8_9PEZI